MNILRINLTIQFCIFYESVHTNETVKLMQRYTLSLFTQCGLTAREIPNKELERTLSFKNNLIGILTET